jgi:hypothetical protein
MNLQTYLGSARRRKSASPLRLCDPPAVASPQVLKHPAIVRGSEPCHSDQPDEDSTGPAKNRIFPDDGTGSSAAENRTYWSPLTSSLLPFWARGPRTEALGSRILGETVPARDGKVTGSPHLELGSDGPLRGLACGERMAGVGVNQDSPSFKAHGVRPEDDAMEVRGDGKPLDLAAGGRPIEIGASGP